MSFSSALAFLLATQNPDGGWAYTPGGASVVEPTAAVALAVGEDPAGAEAHRRAVDWLRQGQRLDGGWGLGHDDGESTWHTAWAVLALARLAAGVAGDSLDKAIRWLLSVETLQVADDEMQKEFKRKSGIDITVQGWPWLPGEAAWTEPTALTMLALESTPAARSPAIVARLNEAVRCLEDRRCLNGGWNVGSPVMLGAYLPPRAHPTAWALLALSGFAPQAIRPEDIAVLRSDMHRDGGVLALAWGLIALRALGQDDAEAQARLAAGQMPDGGWNANPYHTAVALWAARTPF